LTSEIYMSLYLTSDSCNQLLQIVTIILCKEFDVYKFDCEQVQMVSTRTVSMAWLPICQWNTQTPLYLAVLVFYLLSLRFVQCVNIFVWLFACRDLLWWPTDLYYFIQIPYCLFESYVYRVSANKLEHTYKDGEKFCWTVL